MQKLSYENSQKRGGVEMRIAIAIALILGLMAITSPTFAGEPVINHIADAFSGHNDYIETWGYVAKTISLEKVPYVKVLNADLRIEIATPIGEESFEKGILKVGLEF